MGDGDDMTTSARQRYLEAMTFGRPGQIPVIPGNGRQSTRARWHADGLPQDVTRITKYAYEQAGGTMDWPEEDGVVMMDVDEFLLSHFKLRHEVCNQSAAAEKSRLDLGDKSK